MYEKEFHFLLMKKVVNFLRTCSIKNRMVKLETFQPGAILKCIFFLRTLFTYFAFHRLQLYKTNDFKNIEDEGVQIWWRKYQ